MKKRNILIAAVALTLVAIVAMAAVPPPRANQNLGANDSRFDKLGSSVQMPNQSGCRVCHGGAGTVNTINGTQYTNTGLPDRHHNLVSSGEINPVTGAPYGCNNCHPVYAGPNGNQVLIDRECLDCHAGLNFTKADPLPTVLNETKNAKVNISRPHHINTAEAAARNCKFCHSSLVANYDDGHYVPMYSTSLVTPEPHYRIVNATSTDTSAGTGRFWGGCFACHQPDKVIDPSGAWNNVTSVPELLDQHDTHHGAINGNRSGVDNQRLSTPGETCNWCHTVNVSSPTGRPVGYPNELDFEIRNATLLSIGDTVNGTGCEKCHDVGTLHNIQYNYAVTNGQRGYGHIGENWDCNGCHAFWDAGDVSGFEGAIPPNVISVAPARLLTTDSATTVTITGSDFLSGVGTYTVVVSLDGTTTLTPTSVTDTEIVVSVPQLTEGVHTIQVLKQGDPAGDKVGQAGTLVAVEPVDAVSAAKSLVRGKVTVTITGAGFGPQPDVAFEDLGAFVTTTTYNKKGQPTGTATYKLAVSSWSDTQIVGTVKAAASGDPVTVKALAGADTVGIN